MLLLFIFIDCVPWARIHGGLCVLMPEDKWYVTLQFAWINLNETGESVFAHVCYLIIPKQAEKSKPFPSCSVGPGGNDCSWSDEVLSGHGGTQNLCCVCVCVCFGEHLHPLPECVLIISRNQSRGGWAGCWVCRPAGSHYTEPTAMISELDEAQERLWTRHIKSAKIRELNNRLKLSNSALNLKNL